ncbi:MAG TPA: class II aldolase/adducin family protein [Steroidobacteraceae bacterium]|nr:class II aldolase/adducin family protein [Steroidobacteraceae bacterium]
MERKRYSINRRASFGASVVAMAFTAAGAWAQAPAAIPPDVFPADSEEQRIADLVTANHILADQNVLDSYGHVTVRSFKNPKHFLMSGNRAPALVTADDIMEFDENSMPVDQRGRRVYNERFIHGEIYRMRPDVVAVVHSHAPDVLPFTVTDKVPFKALIHMAHFIGSEPVPVFDLEDVEGPNNNMLVLNSKSGEALAKKLGDRNVVLMRGHGMTVVGPNVRRATYNAVYTQVNARVEMDALKLGQPKFMNKFEVQRVGQINRAWDGWADQVKGAGR